MTLPNPAAELSPEIPVVSGRRRGSIGTDVVANPWLAFALRRLVGMVAVLGVLLVATFFLAHLTRGDPSRNIAGIDADPLTLAQVRHAYGFDLPLWQQFFNYVGGIPRLDFGTSYVTGLPVTTELGVRFRATGELAALAVVMVMATSLPVGILAAAATREGRSPRLAVVFTSSASILGAIPGFLMATALSLLLAVWLRWLPVAPGPFIPEWKTIILPAVAIAIGPAALLARIVRVETLNVLAQDYIRTARGKRLPPRLIYVRHVLPNIVTAAMTIAGTLLASLLGGAVIVENVFNWPGLGTRLVAAILDADYPMIEGAILMLGLIVVAVNAAVDVILAILDPRTLNR